jgi:hypothetical protein
MAEARKCDCCGKLIDGFNVILHGYTVKYDERDFPGYSFGYKRDICSFSCLSEWAEKEQELKFLSL